MEEQDQEKKVKVPKKTPLDEWDPMNTDFNDETTNSYKSGIGKDLKNAETSGNSSRLFVTNYPPDLEKVGLKNLFQDELMVNVEVSTTKDKNMKDIAFVTVPTKIASRACHVFNQRQIGQHVLTVRLAQKKNRNREKEETEAETDPIFEELKRNYESSLKALQAHDTKEFIKEKGSARMHEFQRCTLTKGQILTKVTPGIVNWSRHAKNMFVYPTPKRNVVDGMITEKKEIIEVEKGHVALAEVDNHLFRAEVLERLSNEAYVVLLVDDCKTIITRRLYALPESLLDLKIHPVPCRLFGIELTNIVSSWDCIYEIVFEQLLKEDELDVIVKAVSRGITYVDVKSSLSGYSLTDWLVSNRMAACVPSMGNFDGKISHFRDFQHFFVQFNTDAVNEMELALSNVELQYRKNHLVNVKVAKRAKDHKWYRVEMLDDDSALFIDYGWVESIIEVRPLPEGNEFMVSPLAQKIHLEDNFLYDHNEPFDSDLTGAVVDLEMSCQCMAKRIKLGSRIFPDEVKEYYEEFKLLRALKRKESERAAAALEKLSEANKEQKPNDEGASSKVNAKAENKNLSNSTKNSESMEKSNLDPVYLETHKNSNSETTKHKIPKKGLNREDDDEKDEIENIEILKCKSGKKCDFSKDQLLMTEKSGNDNFPFMSDEEIRRKFSKKYIKKLNRNENLDDIKEEDLMSEKDLLKKPTDQEPKIIAMNEPVSSQLIIRKQSIFDTSNYEDIRYQKVSNDEETVLKNLRKMKSDAKDSINALRGENGVDENQNEISRRGSQESAIVSVGRRMKKKDYDFLLSIYGKFNGLVVPDESSAFFVNVIGICESKPSRIVGIISNKKLRKLFEEMKKYLDRKLPATSYEVKRNEIVAVRFNGEWMRAEKHQNYFFCVDIVFYIHESKIEGIAKLPSAFKKVPIFVVFVDLFEPIHAEINCPTFIFGHRVQENVIYGEELSDSVLSPDMKKLKSSSKLFKLHILKNEHKEGQVSGYIDSLKAAPLDENDLEKFSHFSPEEILKHNYKHLILTAIYYLPSFNCKKLLKCLSEDIIERNRSLNIDRDDSVEEIKEKIFPMLGTTSCEQEEKPIDEAFEIDMKEIEEKKLNTEPKPCQIKISPESKQKKAKTNTINSAKVQVVPTEILESPSSDSKQDKIDKNLPEDDTIIARNLTNIADDPESKLESHSAEKQSRKFTAGDVETSLSKNKKKMKDIDFRANARDKLIPLKIPIKDKVMGQITYVENPTAFYFRLSENKEIALKIEELAAVAANKQRSFCNPKRDMLVLVFSKNEWFRAKILEVRDELLKVRLVDHGMKCLVSTNDLRAMPENLRDVPPLAVKCALHNLRPTTDKWSPEACKTFRESIQKQLVSVIARQSMDSSAFVELFAEGLSIRHLLINHKLAYWVDKSEESKYDIDTLSESYRYKEYDLPKLNLNVGDEIGIAIYDFTSPNKFRAQILIPELASNLLAMQEEVNDIFGKEPHQYSISGESQVGDIIYALSSEDNCFYRAIILTAEENTLFQVRFIDYGNESEQLVTEEMRCPPHRRFIEDLPPLAQPFCLKSARDVTFNLATLEKFKKLTKDQKLNAKIVGACGDKYVVDLKTESGDKILDLLRKS